LITGLHTGSAPFVVEGHDAPPDVPDWEEVVEVSFPVPSAAVVLVGWAGGSYAPLDLAPDVYRVRSCATGMDAGKAADVRSAGGPRWIATCSSSGPPRRSRTGYEPGEGEPWPFYQRFGFQSTGEQVIDFCRWHGGEGCSRDREEDIEPHVIGPRPGHRPR
jgi:hypothetical protein